jgi:citrate synthase
MSGDDFGNIIHSTLWDETPQQDNPFVAEVCRASGYDVYGDMLGKAGYIDYLYLLLRGERPDGTARRLLELLCVALANAGPRDPAVHAAMAAAVGGSPAAAALTAALAVGAGSYGGGREVLLAMQAWERNGRDLAAWADALARPAAPPVEEIWPAAEHAPGFAPYATTCPLPVLQTLTLLAEACPGGHAAWLQEQRAALEAAAGCPLGFTGAAAAAMRDLQLDPAEGEMLYLLLRLPGAAAHALEQRRQGFRRFPFFELDLLNDPARKP